MFIISLRSTRFSTLISGDLIFFTCENAHDFKCISLTFTTLCHAFSLNTCANFIESLMASDLVPCVHFSRLMLLLLLPVLDELEMERLLRAFSTMHIIVVIAFLVVLFATICNFVCMCLCTFYIQKLCTRLSLSCICWPGISKWIRII